MSKSIESRLEALEARHKDLTASLYTVHYKDGHKEYKSGGECIELALTAYRDIMRFEEGKKCGNQGCMMGLLNALLDDPDENEVRADDS